VQVDDRRAGGRLGAERGGVGGELLGVCLPGSGDGHQQHCAEAVESREPCNRGDHGFDPFA
jgi:hypothetical protein